MARIREKSKSCWKETWFALGEGSREWSYLVERLESLNEAGVKRCDERERELQKKINSCYSKKIKEDGKVGPETLNAIADALDSAQDGDLC